MHLSNMYGTFHPNTEKYIFLKGHMEYSQGRLS